MLHADRSQVEGNGSLAPWPRIWNSSCRSEAFLFDHHQGLFLFENPQQLYKLFLFWINLQPTAFDAVQLSRLLAGGLREITA
jgi:hypothetical protein